MRCSVPLAVVCVALGATSMARAQEPIRATVVRIEGEDVFLDLARPIAREGFVLALYRPVEVRHPITRRTLRDRFQIGELEITQPGDVLSIAHTRGGMSRNVEVGDVAEAAPPPPSPPQVAEVGPTASQVECAEAAAPLCPALPLADPEEGALTRAFVATLGQPIGRRLVVYRSYLSQFPSSPHRAAIEADLEALSALAPHVRSRDISRGRLRELRAALQMQPIERAIAGQPRTIGLAVRAGAGIVAVRFQYRPRGERAYAVLDLVPDADGHVRGTLPGEAIAPPGFDYFIEVVDDAGLAVEAFASAAHPSSVAVAGAEPAVNTPRSRARLSSEYVSFDTFATGAGRDYYVIVEGDVLYRILYSVLYGVRLGYGSLEGRGRPLRELDMGMPGRDVGWAYGYLELEARFHELFSMVGRFTIGVGQPSDPAVQAEGVRAGAQVRVRIGEELGTHLLLGGEFLPELGLRGYIALQWELAASWPTRAEVHITDQPNFADIGVRVVLEQGYRFESWLALSVRLSYQGRRIDHTGLGAGLALTFDW